MTLTQKMLETLQNEMIRQGISRAELSRRLDVSRGNITIMFQGPNISLKQIEKVAAAINCTPIITLETPVAPKKTSTPIYVSKKSDVPQQEHWAIFAFGSISIPGDERSRTNPGHGYPAQEQSTVNYKAFLNREDWLAEIASLESRAFGKDDYVAFKMSAPAKLTIEVSVKD